MSNMVNFNAQVAPMEHVEKMVRHEQEHDQIRQETLMQSASQLLSRDNEAVQKTAAAKKGRRVQRRNEDDDNGRKGSGFAGKDRGRGGQTDGESLADGSQAGVWSGNIVNLKV